MDAGLEDAGFNDLLRQLGHAHNASVLEVVQLRKENLQLRIQADKSAKEIDMLAGSATTQAGSSPSSLLPDIRPKEDSSTVASKRGPAGHTSPVPWPAKVAQEFPEEEADEDVFSEVLPEKRLMPNYSIAVTSPRTPALSPSGSRFLEENATATWRRSQPLQVRQAWIASRALARPSLRHSIFSRNSLHPLNGSEEELAKAKEQLKKSLFHNIIMVPSDPKRLVWDLCGMVLLAYDVIFIPLGAFSLGTHPFYDLMDWLTLIFWTGDVFMSCITGYIVKGQICVAPSRILLHYLKTWFFLDLIVIGPDWTFTILLLMDSTSDTDSGNLTKLFRALRVVRTIRLLRLAKLQRLISLAKDRITSETVFIALNIVKLIVGLMLINHLIGSVWFGIGQISGTHNWIDANELHSTSVGYQYATSLHWSLTQFTPGSMNVQPVNLLERWYSILVLISGLVIFSSFISSITASMTQLRSLKDDKAKQFWLLRRFLAQRHVPIFLSYRILRYADYATSTDQDYVPESRLWVLNSLTSQLRDELKFVTTFFCLESQPMFAYLIKTEEALMHRLSRSALSELTLASGDPLFSVAELSTCMYFVQSGALQYERDPVLCRVPSPEEDSAAEAQAGQRSPANVDRPSQRLSPSSANSSFSLSSGPLFSSSSHAPPLTVYAKECICEISLWVTWMHVGSAHASLDSNLIAVNADDFAEAVGKDPVAWEKLAAYGRAVVDWAGELEDFGEMETGGPISTDFSAKYFARLEEDDIMHRTTFSSRSRGDPMAPRV
ncbi:unnamed protein product [Polarella glacialis]|uniref:Cyclic nucleotide-binding domain-containing protein n=1 Tax=Polarella glacialis TaxID=89957 RepID=A0A813IMJ6_POLGL|nr:unnamed protein product [Polarella glacialis]